MYTQKIIRLSLQYDINTIFKDILKRKVPRKDKLVEPYAPVLASTNRSVIEHVWAVFIRYKTIDREVIFFVFS